MSPLRNAYGSLFPGELTAEVYADKIVGANHSLPIGRTARYAVGAFGSMCIKAITLPQANNEASMMPGCYAETQSAFEQMNAHRNATICQRKFSQ